MIDPEILKEFHEDLRKLFEHKVFTDAKEEDMRDPSQYFSFLRQMIEVERALQCLKESTANMFKLCTFCGSLEHKSGFTGCKEGYYCEECYQFGHQDYWTEGMCGDYECTRCNKGHAGDPCEDLR